jgi:hypothetical protein
VEWLEAAGQECFRRVGETTVGQSSREYGKGSYFSWSSEADLFPDNPIDGLAQAKSMGQMAAGVRISLKLKIFYPRIEATPPL